MRNKDCVKLAKIDFLKHCKHDIALATIKEWARLWTENFVSEDGNFFRENWETIIRPIHINLLQKIFEKVDWSKKYTPNGNILVTRVNPLLKLFGTSPSIETGEDILDVIKRVDESTRIEFKIPFIYGDVIVKPSLFMEYELISGPKEDNLIIYFNPLMMPYLESFAKILPFVSYMAQNKNTFNDTNFTYIYLSLFNNAQDTDYSNKIMPQKIDLQSLNGNSSVIKNSNNIEFFCKKWLNRGKEDADDHLFWIDILQQVLGADNATNRIEFQKKVIVDGHTKKIDAYISETKVLIEQKSYGIPLDRKMLQSDGALLTPYEQAKRYNDNLPLSQKARWIVVSNFKEIWVYDMENVMPEISAKRIFISDLLYHPHLLDFLLLNLNK